MMHVYATNMLMISIEGLTVKISQCAHWQEIQWTVCFNAAW